MKRTLLFLLAFTCFTIALQAAPTPTPSAKRTSNKNEKTAVAPETIAQSANGWYYTNGEWVHPDGYKFVNNKVLRTTARTGRAFPKPPGKLALDNPQKLGPKTNLAPAVSQTEAEKKAEIKRKNLQPSRAPQTGFH